MRAAGVRGLWGVRELRVYADCEAQTAGRALQSRRGLQNVLVEYTFLEQGEMAERSKAHAWKACIR